MADPGEVTALLRAFDAGDTAAFDRLVPLVYDDLLRIARRQLGRGPRATLDTSSLVHEAYMKLSGGAGAGYQNRSHLLAVAAVAMRQVVIGYARHHAAQRRGAGARHVTFDEREIAVDEQAEDLIAVDAALERLAQHDMRLGRVVECRFFAGLSEEETAQALGVSLRTAQRDWQRARAWLIEDLRGPGAPPSGPP